MIASFPKVLYFVHSFWDFNIFEKGSRSEQLARVCFYTCRAFHRRCLRLVSWHRSSREGTYIWSTYWCADLAMSPEHISKGSSNSCTLCVETSSDALSAKPMCHVSSTVCQKYYQVMFEQIRHCLWHWSVQNRFTVTCSLRWRCIFKPRKGVSKSCEWVLLCWPDVQHEHWTNIAAASLLTFFSLSFCIAYWSPYSLTYSFHIPYSLITQEMLATLKFFQRMCAPCVAILLEVNIPALLAFHIILCGTLMCKCYDVFTVLCKRSSGLSQAFQHQRPMT